MFPVYVYKQGMELPDSDTYYVVAGNGIFLHKNTGIFNGFVSVENISCLDDLNFESKISMNIPKIPHEITWKLKKFFTEVYHKFHSECEATLLYSNSKKEFKVIVPEQIVSHTSVNYERKVARHVDDFLQIGTIHSHCDFSAFHSTTDVDDEKEFDGIHITFGNNNDDLFTISASLTANNNRIVLDPLCCMEGIQKIEDKFVLIDVDKENEDLFNSEIDLWMQKVKTRNVSNFSSLYSSVIGNYQ